jgi:hypothetical protein
MMLPFGGDAVAAGRPGREVPRQARDDGAAAPGRLPDRLGRHT